MRGCVGFVLLTVGCGGAAGGGAPDPGPPPQPVTVSSASAPANAGSAAGTPDATLRHLDARVELVDGDGGLVVRGDVVWHVTLGPSRTVHLDAVGLEFTSVAQAGVGTALEMVKAPTHVTIGPIAGRPGDEARVKLRYRAAPTRGLKRAGQTAWTAFHTWHWLPVPSDPSQRATLELGVTPPSDWEGAAVLATGDGPLRSGPDIATKVPHPSYVWGFFVGATGAVDRTEQAGLPVQVWTQKPGHRGASVAAAQTASAWRRWRDSGGAWPGGDTPEPYHQVFVPGTTATELAGMTFLPEAYLDRLASRPSDDALLVRELVHQVWGNRVTSATWGDFWLHESFPTWWVSYDLSLRGETNETQRQAWRERVDAAIVQGEDLRVARPGATASDADGVVIDSGGALILDAFARSEPRRFVARVHAWGEEAMRQGHRNLTTREFLDGLALSPDERTRAETMLTSAATITEPPAAPSPPGR
ncbi:MAG: M1 family aminopeptidase [Myxococcota bacterium]